MSELGEVTQKSGPPSQLMLELNVRHEAWDQNNIEWPVAHHLIGDADVAAERVTRNGQFHSIHWAFLKKRVVGNGRPVRQKEQARAGH